MVVGAWEVPVADGNRLVAAAGFGPSVVGEACCLELLHAVSTMATTHVSAATAADDRPRMITRPKGTGRS